MTKKQRKAAWIKVLKMFDQRWTMQRGSGICNAIYLCFFPTYSIDVQLLEELNMLFNDHNKRWIWDAMYFYYSYYKSSPAYTERINALGLLIAMNS